MRFAFASSLVLFGSLVACTGTVADVTADGTEAVTGVTDFSAIEAEFGLVKDTQDAQGHWSRSDATLATGLCYKRTLGGAHGASYEVRRYRQGAAFFPKLGMTPATGDERPVSCIDFDIVPAEKGDDTVMSLGGVALDTAMRYHLGKPTGWDAGLGHLYTDFERGNVEVSGADHYCAFLGEVDRSPGGDAYRNALASCKQTGASDDTCNQKAMTACESATTKDMVRDSIDRPTFDQGDAKPSTYFYYVQVADPENKDSQVDLQGPIAAAVYRYALKTATAHGAFTLAGDPVGKFQKFEYVEIVPSVPGEYAEHLRFEHMDAHHVVSAGVDQLAITPKGSDANIVASAAVLCTRTVGNEGEPTSDYQCRGL
jgi:hypothetical protein